MNRIRKKQPDVANIKKLQWIFQLIQELETNSIEKRKDLMDMQGVPKLTEYVANDFNGRE